MKMQVLTAQIKEALDKVYHLRQGERRQIEHKEISNEGESAAIVCGTTRVGDVITQIYNFLLILRQSSWSNEWDIVGQGFPLPGWMMSDCDASPENIDGSSAFKARLSLNLTPLEIMRLIGQDFVDFLTYDRP